MAPTPNVAGASNATYRLGSLSGTTGTLENLNPASGTSTFEIGALNTSTTFGGVIRDLFGTVGITNAPAIMVGEKVADLIRGRTTAPAARREGALA